MTAIVNERPLTRLVSVAHYLSHLLYSLSQLPLIGLMVSQLRRL
jgi:hypothetical protein